MSPWQRLLKFVARGLLLAWLPSSVFAAGDHKDEHEHAHDEVEEGEPAHHHGEEEAEPLAPAEIAAHGVGLEVAGPGTIDLALELPGEVRPNAERLAHIAPRFPGIARSVRRRIGDKVVAGEVLATVEAENTATIQITAPFASTVLDCHIVEGEVVSSQEPAFLLADLSDVWVTIYVYQQDLHRVRLHQPVRISESGHPPVEGAISYISPVVDQATRTALARVVLPNGEGRWRPGVFVTAAVLEPVHVAVVIPPVAIQRHEGREVVFVAHESHFEPRPITIGRRGLSLVEVTSGLRAGERYASRGSFLVKADQLKGSGEHSH